MSEHNKFDDYIKGLFDDDPKVPSELAWESMEFDLPPAPEKKSNKKYLLLLLLLLIGLPALYLGVSKNKESNSTITDLTNETIIKSAADNRITLIDKDEINTNVFVEQTVSTSQESNTINTGNVNSVRKKINFTKTEKSLSSSLTNIAGDKQIVDEIQNSVSPRNKLLPRAEVFEVNRQKIAPIAPLASQSIADLSIPQIAEIQEELDALLADKKDKSLMQEVYLAYGYNQFNLQADDTNILKSRLSGALGNSYKLGLKLRVSDNWKANISAKYDQYHSVFEHSRDLEAEIDLENLVKINREEITYHNNFTNTFGLQLGIERHFQLVDKVSFYAGLSLNPTYISTASGKTVADLNNQPTIYNNQIGDFSLNGGANTGLSLPINRFFNVGLDYQFNSVLWNKVYVNEGVNSNQQSVLSMFISYKIQ